MNKVEKIKAEIERLQDGLMDADGNLEYPEHQGAYNVLCNLDAFIDSLEVKEVDLEDDVDKILEENDWNFDKIDFYQFARHFFELGIKVKK